MAHLESPSNSMETSPFYVQWVGIQVPTIFDWRTFPPNADAQRPVVAFVAVDVIALWLM